MALAAAFLGAIRDIIAAHYTRVRFVANDIAGITQIDAKSFQKTLVAQNAHSRLR